MISARLRPSISDIAAVLGMSYRGFCRHVESIKLSGRQIRSWCCITYAAHLIGSGIKVEAAMTLAGFRNHTHFNEQFRRCLGCLPREFRGKKMRLLKAS